MENSALNYISLSFGPLKLPDSKILAGFTLLSNPHCLWNRFSGESKVSINVFPGFWGNSKFVGL